MEKRKINIYEILRTDQASKVFVGIFLGLLLVLIYVYGSIEIFGGYRTRSGGFVTFKKDAPFIISLHLTGGVICIIGILTRYIYFKNILTNQVLVKGVIKKLSYNKSNQVYIEFSYFYNEHNYKKKKDIGGGNYKISQAEKDGSDINILINKNKPGQFIIADLYKSARSFY